MTLAPESVFPFQGAAVDGGAALDFIVFFCRRQ